MIMAAALEGELTFARMPALLPQADALLGSPRLSLAGVTRADSAGLAFLLELTRRGRSRGLELGFSSAPPQVLELARFFGLESSLRFES
ncbi:MAG: hypothetical protein NVS9B10_19050 [Nevskia sp.]